MHITPQELKASAVRLSVREGETEIARAFLYLINNNLHDKPYGLLEDVFVQKPRLRQENSAGRYSRSQETRLL